MRMDKEWGEVPSRWGVYFSVADLEATIEKHKSLGGRVMVGPFVAEKVGTIAILTDPQGANFSVITEEHPRSP